MSILIKNIKQLLQVRNEGIKVLRGEELSNLPLIENAFLLIDDDTIVDFGPMDQIGSLSATEEINAEGRVVMPTWYDSHTHIVYAGNRVGEFVDRINGLSYSEIAERGGGILNSAELLRKTSEDELYEQSLDRIKKIIQLGTGGLEIKSGYGLSVESELKMLRVIKRLKENLPIPVKATLLAAHAVPKEYKERKSEYLDLIISEILPVVKKENLADFIDIFCEEGYFDIQDTERILSSGLDYGLKGKIHVNQFNSIGGVRVAVKYNALSVDHLEELTDEDIHDLKTSETIPVALPGCSFFLGIPYTPARKLIDSGLPLALATDNNPGSSPSGNMNFVVSAACIKMKMTPAEAINAATINGAFAMGISKVYGSIHKGAKANLIITQPIPDFNYIPYSFGENNVDQVIIKGRVFNPTEY